MTPNAIPLALDRLVEKRLVSCVESNQDRRVRTVVLTAQGRDLIVPAFRKHSAQMKKVFSSLSPKELGDLETALRKVGKSAAALTEQN